MELPNTSLQAIELNSICSWQAYPNMPYTGPKYENTEPGCILKVLCVPSKFIHSRVQMPSPARLFKRFHTAGINGHLDLKSLLAGT